jgi:hypothetical protein
MTHRRTSAEEYSQLAAAEATLAKDATSNETRARHYAMADYYTRLAESLVKQKAVRPSNDQSS